MLVAMVLLITDIIMTYNNHHHHFQPAVDKFDIWFRKTTATQKKHNTHNTQHTTHIHTPQVERETRLQVSRLVCLQVVLRETEEKVAIYQQCMARFKKESVWSG